MFRPGPLAATRDAVARTRILLSLALLLGLTSCGRQDPDLSPVLQTFARSGHGPGELSYPRAGLAVDDQLFVVDKTGRIQRFDARGAPLGAWRMPEIDAGKPTGLGADAHGNVYAADTHYGRVIVFDRDGRELARFGSFGEGPGQFKLPTDVAVDADGSVYVSEYGGNDRISKFSPRYEYLFSFGGRDAGAARLERPQSLCVAPDQTLWVADACRHRICHFAPDGGFLGSFGELGSAPGQLRFPYSIDRLPDGSLVVAEYGNNRIQRFSTRGESLGVWGGAGREPGQVAYPWQAVVIPGSRIAVIDSGNNRVQVFDATARGVWRR